jgi:hypothetical protein
MKIKRHMIGGITYSPIRSSMQQQQAAAAASSSSDPEKISGTMKAEIIKILTESGIPSDVDAFLNAANSFLNKSSSLSSKSLFGGTNDDYSMSELITIQGMANKIKWNKGLYDTAVQKLNSEHA